MHVNDHVLRQRLCIGWTSHVDVDVLVHVVVDGLWTIQYTRLDGRELSMLTARGGGLPPYLGEGIGRVENRA